MSCVTQQAFEHGEAVTDTRTDSHGQVRCATWDPRLEMWRYCISRKDIDDETKWPPECFLKRAPAQTRIDKKNAKILYAPRKLKHQQRSYPPPRRTKVNIKEPYNQEAWRSKKLLDVK
jgi:hypothetical protein